MLTMMRNLLRTKAAGLLFIILIVAMGAWGVTDVFGGGLGKNLVGAGNRTISDQQFDATVERVLRSQTDDRGRSLTKEQALDSGLIDRIFQQEQIDLALRAYGDKVGVTATQKAVQDALTSNTIFHDTTGVFDPNQYRALLQNNGLRPDDYQDNIESTLTISRLQLLPISGLKVPNALARVEAAFNGELRSAVWFALPKSALPEIGDPTDEDLQTLYTDRQDALREPERRRISLIRLSPDDFMSHAKVNDLDVEGFYDAYKAERYTGPDSRAFTEFQFSTEEAARAALGRIAGGASSDALDGLTSVGERSGRAQTILNQRLSQQVFGPAAQTGGVYGPQPSGEQWTIIRLERITPGDATPLENVRDAIFNELAREQAIGFYYEALPRFDDLIGTGAALEDIAMDLGVPLLSFDAVDLQGFAANGARFTPLTEAPDLIAKAFDRPIGGTTERFGDDEVTWMGRVDAIVDASTPEFVDVQELLEFAWRQSEDAKQLQTTAGEIEQRIKSGEQTLAEAAAQYGKTMEILPRPLSRVNFQANLPPTLINGLFEAREEGDLLSAPGLPGEIIVMQVTTIDRPEPETLDLLAVSTAASLQNQVADDLYQAFFAEIQKETELKVNGGALDAYKRGIVPQQ